MCFASHRQPKREASHSLTIRLLVCINYRDRVLFPKPWELRAEKNIGIAAKPAGLNTAEDQMSTYRPVDSASVMEYPRRRLTHIQYPSAMARVRTPPDDSLRAALHTRSCIHRKQRNVVIPNWHNTQPWHTPGAVAAP
jgi:hypothetical protein